MIRLISHYPQILFDTLLTQSNIVLSQEPGENLALERDTLVTTEWPHIKRTSPFKTSAFQGTECDDTEYRDHSGSPAWKNYGNWLSECDSIETVYHDKMFAERRKAQKEKEELERQKMLSEPLDDLDLDAMWENTVWNEIQDVQDISFEVENITAVAGVRGAEAEDEALEHLYYRRSMKGLTLLDMQKAYGKLKLKRDNIYKQDPDNPDIIKLDSYMLQLKKRMI